MGIMIISPPSFLQYLTSVAFSDQSFFNHTISCTDNYLDFTQSASDCYAASLFSKKTKKNIKKLSWYVFSELSSSFKVLQVVT